MTEERRGLLYGFAAFGLWGLFPLYWPLLDPASAVEVLAHRIVWSLVVVAVLVVVLRLHGRLVAVIRDRRRLRLLALAALVISANWVTYIWGVMNEHVVEAALGYFINPLVLVLLGVLVLGERLRRWQWVGLAIAAAGVVELTVDYGRLPYVALVLACTFGTYGLLKKKAAVGAIEGLAVETALLAPLAVGYLTVLQVQAAATVTGNGVGHAVLLAGTGAVTALPLLLFGAAAPRVRLTTIGLLQYVAPVVQFVLGLVVFDEPMSAARWVGFGLVWLALAVVTVEATIHLRQGARPAGREALVVPAGPLA